MHRLLIPAALAACVLFATASATAVFAAEAHSDTHAPAVNDNLHEHQHATGPWPLALLGIYCLLVVAASLFGGWLPTLVQLTHSRMQTLISFVGGLMLGIGLFHLLPHAILELGSVDRAIYWMMGGILAMFLLMRTSHAHHHEPIDLVEPSREASHDHDHDAGHTCAHSHESAKDTHAHPFSWFGLALGLCLHSLIDGVALGAHVSADAGHGPAFSLLGLGTFLGVLLHKPLDAIPITSLMAAGGWSARSRHLANVAFSLICPLGAVLFVLGVAQLHGYQQDVIGCALAFAAGVFLCISLGDLLPEMEFHSHDRVRLSLALAAGIALAWGITFLEPGHLHASR